MESKNHILDCAMDPQSCLSQALQKRNIIEFRVALDMGADPCHYDDNNTNVYETALKSYGCAKFVEECLRRNCSINHVNLRINKAAINYAADSQDPEIVTLLLKTHNIDLNHQYGQLTPLNSLVKNLTESNTNNILTCVKILIGKGASANITDQRQMTPLHYILKNGKIDNITKRQFIQAFLSASDLDIDTYREGEVRRILNRDFPEFILPSIEENRNINANTLLSLIRSGDVQSFLTLFNDMSDNALHEIFDNVKYRQPILIEVIKRGANTAFDCIHIKINQFFSDEDVDNNKLFEVAISWGNWYVLQKLLQSPKIKWRGKELLLVIAIQKMNETPKSEHSDYSKCFYILLQSEDININATDKSGSTALHYAVKYRNNIIIEELLKHGAYIGAKSSFGTLPIEGINPELLENHFNSCISSNGLKIGDENFEICINYMNLLPEICSSTGRRNKSSTKNRKQTIIAEEMTAISYIAKSKEYRYLLQHPLITSFLFLKWHRLSLAFYINFLIYILFTISIITHTVLKFRESENETVTIIFGLFSWIGIAYMILREFIQVIISPLHYCCAFTNWMEVSLIILSVVTCIEPTYDRETQKVIAVFTILLISIELCILVGSLPVLSISTHMLMLDAVCRSFLKSFALYSIFVITFSLCFYILIGKPEKLQGKLDTEYTTEEENGDFNKFTNPLAAVIKTIVMLTGEFDAGDIEFDSFYSYLLFLLFVLLMSIVLFNLLNGLAVSDTQAIKDQAELNGAICRTNVLSRYEQVLTGYSKYSSFIANQEPFRTICSHFFNLYPNYIADRQIVVLPNNNNKVLISIRDTNAETRTISDSKTTFLRLSDTYNDPEIKQSPLSIKFLSCCCSNITAKCSEMDHRTVKLALAVIEQKSIMLKSKVRLQKSEQRLQNIENKLDKLYELLQETKFSTK